MANFGYIGCQKNVPKAPWYAYEIFPTHEDWTGPFILPSAHKYSDCHNCKFDYKKFGKEILKKNNPKIISTKIDKI